MANQMAEYIRIPALDDNYIWMLRNPDTGSLAVIDPGEHEAVLAVLEERGLTPTEIINTHHHADHIDGNAELMRRFSIPLTAPAAETSRIPDITNTVSPGDTITIADYTAHVLASPGHTSGHVAFHLPDCFGDAGGMAFVGDTMFSLGCGRVFEGSMEDMWNSLLAIRALPDATLIAAGHEYSEGNARYVESLGWDRPEAKARCEEIYALRKSGEPTLPVMLGDEKKSNPFLNCDDASLAKALGVEGGDGVAVFTALREGKDNF